MKKQDTKRTEQPETVTPGILATWSASRLSGYSVTTDNRRTHVGDWGLAEKDLVQEMETSDVQSDKRHRTGQKALRLDDWRSPRRFARP